MAWGLALNAPSSAKRSLIRYPAYIEVGLDGHAVGYAFRLPGLFVEASTPEAALAALPSAIATEYAWLARHGVAPAFAAEPVEIEEVERIDLGTDVSRGIWRGLFQYELRRTGDEDIETALERARFARTDVLAAWAAMTDAERAAHAPSLIAHADTEWELLSKLGRRLRDRLPDNPVDRIGFVRREAEGRFRNLLPGDRERMAVFDGEKWTTRKVLRCYGVGERRLLRGLTAVPA
jgi:predicted RNase H-like HicB family nuclease